MKYRILCMTVAETVVVTEKEMSQADAKLSVNLLNELDSKHVYVFKEVTE